ncbi:hypothetical protein [Cohnella abietis]|nr:hypothetical protein [Cohnella abietis]
MTGIMTETNGAVLGSEVAGGLGISDCSLDRIERLKDTLRLPLTLPDLAEREPFLPIFFANPFTPPQDRATVYMTLYV